jgi:hypothetical protein
VYVVDTNVVSMCAKFQVNLIIGFLKNPRRKPQIHDFEKNAIKKKKKNKIVQNSPLL